MCMEDVELGRKTYGQQIILALGSGIVQVCGGDVNRKSITFSPIGQGSGSSTAVTYSTDPAVVLGAGLNLFNFGIPFTMTIETHGDIICKPWYAVTGGGAFNSCVFLASLSVERR